MKNFALIGCGRIAKRHSDLLGQNQIRGAKLVAVCDIDYSKAQALSERLNINAYSDYSEMLSTEKIDVAVILTDSGSHAEVAIDIADKVKNIVVEKPMALKIDDAEKMIEACEDNGTKLFVVKQNRYNLPVTALRGAVDQGKFGKLNLCTVRVRWCRTQEYYDQASWRGTWKNDGGVLTNQASHHLDLLEWLGGDIESVYAKSMNAMSDIEAEDTAVVVVKFCSGALGLIEATTATRPKDIEGSISILGERGTVEIGGFAVNEMKIWQFDSMSDQDNTIKEKFSVNPPNVYGFGHKEYYEHVMSVIEGEDIPMVDGHEGIKSLKLINAIYVSSESGKEIFLKDSPVFKKLGN